MSKGSTKLRQSQQPVLKQFADHVMRGTGEAPYVVFGPVVWDDRYVTKRWYFMVATSDTEGAFRADRFGIDWDDRRLAEEARGELMCEIIRRAERARATPAILFDLDDELRMAQFCEATWPYEKTRGIRQAIESEDALRAA